MDVVLEALGTIWSPGAAALKLQQSMNIMSLEDLIVATERAGYEISEVDLPRNVGGFALETWRLTNMRSKSNTTIFKERLTIWPFGISTPTCCCEH
jgi:hypothetical protein